jgi:hypothetical protein
MKIKIRVESLPLHFVLLGVAMVIFAMFDWLSSQSYIFDIVLLILGVLLTTSHQKLVIDKEGKKYNEFYWVLGLKVKKYEESFQEITSVFCESGKYSQQYGKYNRRFINGTMYNGYIELKDQENLYIGQNKRKQSLLNRLEKIGAQLNVAVEDRVDSDS